MRRTLAQLTLATLIVACSEKPTAPGRQTSAVTPGTASSGAAGANAAHLALCSNPSGSVFVRAQCHANEEQLDPVALGLVGPQGPPGAPGISGYEIVSHKESIAAGSTANAHVECQTGKKVLGGGFSVETPADVKLFTSEPSDGNGNIIDHGWNVFAQNAGTVARQTTAIAICGMVQ